MISCRKDIPDGIPFTFFTSLIREIAEDTAPKTHRKPQNPLDTFNRWLKRLRKDFSPLPPGTTSIIFRFLFPHEDPRRKYGMQETKLSKELADCLCISDSRLVEWEEKGETVCLGDQLRHIMNPACSDPDEICSLSIAKVDALLDELAALSRFASDSIHAKFPDKRCMKRETVLRELFRQMTPFDAACLTQIILRDLRPLMYPLCEKQMHYTSALKELKSNCVAELKIYDAMIAWDPQYALRNSYRVCCSLVDACDAFERDKLITMPSFGVQLEIPKSQKGRSLSHALNFLPQSKKVWAETKYDGERAQIHLKISNRVPKIKIFSKSKRDSTDDRLGVHPVILECLRLEKIESVILDAEMVPFSGEKIEGFWKIRRLIESTARGARRRVAGESESEPETQETQFTQISTEQDCPSQLGLVFFDVMYLNGKSLLTQPYQKRRETLEDLIRVLPGKALLAKRQEIDTNYSQQQGGLASFLLPSKRKATDNVNPETSLGRIFAGTLASHEEGLVLKAAESGYNDWKLPWVKLKQDYIPGLGDTVDLVVVGAGWQKERGMELRVPRNTLITFYIGAQTNKEKTADNPALKPHFRVYFTASYGLTRDELEEANFLVKSNDPIRYKDENKHEILPYDFTLDTDTKPQVLLREPLLADLFGDRFTKAHENAYFGIRWARLTKIYRPAERSWREGLSLSEVQTAALQALGVDLDITIDAARIWKGGNAILPSDDEGEKLKKWEIKLGVAENEQNVKSPRKRNRGFVESGPSKKRQTRAVPPVEDHLDLDPDQSSQPLRIATNLPHDSASRSEKPLTTDQTHEVEKICAYSGSSQNTPMSNPSRAIRKKYPSPPTSPADPRPLVLNRIHTRNIAAETAVIVYGGSTLSDFLQSAVTWYDTEVAIVQMFDSALSHLQNNRVHSPEALLVGCGWDPSSSSSLWVERAVVFLNPNTPASRTFEQVLLSLLKPRLGTISPRARKPIWIFNSATFNWCEPFQGQALGVVK